MSEMTEIPENANKPMHKYVYFAILCVTAYVAAIIDSFILYTFDLYSVFVSGNEPFNLMMTLGWPLAISWDLYMRFIQFHGSTAIIWIIWAALLVIRSLIKNRMDQDRSGIFDFMFLLVAVLIPVVLSILNVQILELGVASTEITEFLLVLSPLVVFLVISVGIGEYYVLRKQVEDGTFLHDQYVPSYDYVE